jgi:cation transport regulator ChaC
LSLYVFGYGSLINKQSFERALKRELTHAEFHIAEVADFRRCWRAKENLYFEQLGRSAIGVFLDIYCAPGESVNGVLVEISETELDQLKKREKNYKCIDISAHVCDCRAQDSIYTFVAQPEHYLSPDDADVYIPQRYVEMVIGGARALGDDFVTAYYGSTDGYTDISVLDGRYSFLDVEQKKYV